jgi:hypothetical protein
MALPGRLNAALAAALLLASCTLWPSGAAAHTGNRLRLGYRPEPALSALARLTQINLREATVYTVDLREFKDAATLEAALKAGEVDMILEYPAEAWCRSDAPGKDALSGNIQDILTARYREAFGAVWVGAFNLPGGGPACRAPSCVIARGIAGDLAYYLLPDYCKKLIAAVTPGDMEQLLRRDPSGTGRDLLREYLAGKRLI